VSLDLADVLAFASATAEDAGREILERDGLFPQAPSMKGLRDPVTEADLASERLIVERLTGRFPDHAIFAEEETRVGSRAGLTWYVDPLDGTVNFSQAHPFFAVSLALYDGPRPLLGVVHAPRLGETFAAAAGRGATLRSPTQAAAQPLSVSSKQALIEAVLATGFAYRRHELVDNNVGHFARLVLQVRGIRRAGSAALDLAYVAAGRLDGYWESDLNPFDLAAGALLVQAAGGVVSDMHGGQDWLQSGSIVAGGAAMHAAVLQQLQAGAPS